MTRAIRRLLLATSLVIAAVAGIVVFEPQSLFDDDPAPAPAERETAAASTQTLATEFSADGTFVYDESTTAFASTSGPDPAVVTGIVEADAEVTMGDVLWEVGFEPTVLLFGSQPNHRDLAQDDTGTDVLQLELNLVALGFDPDNTVTVDDTFTYNTSLMVERWQESIGAEVTGEVRHGAVVYAADDRRVGLVEVAVGDAITDGQSMLQLTGHGREIIFSVSSADRETVALGDTVDATLSDRTQVVGTVSSIVITETGGATVTATVTEAPDVIADTVPATTTWSVMLADQALAVPEAALVRMDSGRYYVERAEDGAWIEVEPGASSDGWVEVSGELADGDVIISP